MVDENYDLNIDTSGYQQSMAAAMGTTAQFSNALGSLSTGSARAGQAISLVTLPVRILEKGFGGFANTAAQAQTQLSQLRGTSALTGQSFRALSGEADKLARSFPITNAGAAQLVTQIQALGVSGVGSEQRIGALGKTMIQLASATGSSSSQITQSMAGVSRAFGDGGLDPKRIARFGDSLTTLTARFGGTAGGILEFTKNIAPFARQAGIGESATLGIAGAFSKLGDDGASAATAVNKILGDINKSVRDGGPQINTYANIVGKTADQFRNLAKSNPAEALSQVVDALGKGTEGQRALERLGLNGVRTQRALSALSQGGELRGAINTAVGAYGSGSTSKASEEALKGLNNALTTLQSTGEQLAVVLGTPLLGGLTHFADALKFPVALLNSMAGSGVGHGALGVVGDLSMGLLAKKLFVGAGNASAGLGLLGTNSVARGLSAGRTLEKFGDGTNSAESFAQARAADLSPRQKRSLDAYEQLLKKSAEADAAGTKVGPMYKAGLGAAAYTMQRPEATKVAMAQRRAEMLAHQTKIYGEETAKKMEQVRDEADRKMGTNDVKRGFTYGARPYSQLQQLKSYYSTTLQRTYNTDDNFERANVDTPKGSYAHPWAGLKGAFSKDLVGDEGGVAKLTDRIKAMQKASGEASAVMSAMPLRKTLLDITQAQARPIIESGKSIGKFGKSVGQTGMSLAGDMFGSPWAMAGMAAVGIGSYAMSTHSADQQMRKANDDRFTNMSTTGVIDSYRDSIGKATANTVTMADEMIQVSKKLNEGALAVSGTTKLTRAEIEEASNTRKKVVNKYTGSASQIAAEIGGLNIGGLTTAEQSAIRLDLGRQLSVGKANQVIGMTDWTGKQGITTSMGGVGTLTDDYIGKRNAQAAGSYKQEGDTRNLWSKLGNSWLGDISPGRLIGPAVSLWGGSAHLGKQASKQIDETAQALGQVYDQQNTSYGQSYAMQERVQSANKIIADARKRGVSKDQLKYTEQELAKGLGADGHQFDASDYGKNTQFSDLLYKNDKTYRNNINNLGIKGSQVSGGLTALSQESPLAQALGQVGGSYGALFSNTKPTASSNAVNDSLSQPGDANKLDIAVNTIIKGSLKAGMSLNDVADAAARAGAKMSGDETLPAWQMQEAVRQKALQQQSFGDAFRAPGANIALSIQTHTADLNNTGTDPASVKRRQDAQAALAQDAANLRNVYVQRIEADRAYQIQTGRSTADFHLSMSNQTTDFLIGQKRAEFDYHEGVDRANRNYHQQTLRAEEDFHITRYRQQRDFATQMKRGAEDAASSMYAPYQRIAVQQVWDGRSLQVNMAQQVDAIRKQKQNLDQLRKQGVSDLTIRQLDLTNTANSQQLGQLVGDTGHDKGLAALLNATSSAKNAAAGGLYNDKDNTSVQRSKDDFQKSLSDQAKDFAKSAKRTAFDFKQSLADQYADYTKTVRRGEEDFKKAQDRENVQFQTSMTRMHDDLINSRKVIDGDLASLQKAANKGIANSEGDWQKIMGDGLDKAQAALDKFAPGYLATLRDLQSGVAGLGNTGAGIHSNGPQFTASGGAAADGGVSGGGNSIGDSAITKTTHDRRTGETFKTNSYVTPGSGKVVGNPRGDGPANGQNNYRPSSDFMSKHPANADFNKSIAKSMGLSKYKWGADEMNSLDALWTRESGWNQYADNSSSDAYGIAQALPATKMSDHGSDWRTNPATQISWGLDYIKARYKDPLGAEAHENQFGWYARGAILSGAQMIGVGEKGPEAVIPLNTQGVAVLAAAMSKYMSSADHKSMTTAGSKTYVHYDYSMTHEDHSTKIMGDVTVKAESPTELGRQLHRKKRMDNLTGGSRG